MQEVMFGLISAFGLLVTVIAGTGGYLLNRLKTLEKRDSQADAAVRTERDQLRQRVADLEAKAQRVPLLETQVAMLTTQVEKLQERLDRAEAETKNKQAEIDRLKTRLDESKARIETLDADNRTLRVENSTYERALTLLGLDLSERKGADQADAPEPAPEPGEGRETDAVKESSDGA